MSLTFKALNTADGLDQLNQYFLGRTFVFGIGASSADADLLKLVGACPDAAKYPHAARWFNYITSMGDAKLGNSAKCLTVGVAKAAVAAKAAADEDEDDSDDLFGDDSEEEEEELAVVEQKIPKLRERTQFVFEIKPHDDTTDLEALALKVKVVTMETNDYVKERLAKHPKDPRMTMEKCLLWGEGHDIKPVAYGICMLVVSCIVVDDAIDSQDIIDTLEEMFGEEYVKSVDMKTCNKASVLKLPK